MTVMDLINGEIPLPSQWSLVPIGEAYSFTKKPRSLILGSDIPFLRMENIPLDKVYLKEVSVHKDSAGLGSCTYFENGDLLLAKITPSFENGKQVIVDFEHEFGFASTELIPIKGVDTKSDILYLYFLLKNYEFRNYLAGKMEGTTGRQRLNKTALSEQLIPLPLLDEQKKIVKVLISIQNSIDLHENLLNKAVELKATSINNLMTGQMSALNLDFNDPHTTS
ncbi:restriction endonuclease subunit S [Patescibacteria group bacterium]|nr:restriction endonuclease subunit S [Patescibacteria group bacterium]